MSRLFASTVFLAFRFAKGAEFAQRMATMKLILLLLVVSASMAPALAEEDCNEKCCAFGVCEPVCKVDCEVKKQSPIELPGSPISIGSTLNELADSDPTLRQAAKNVNEFVKGLTKAAKTAIDQALRAADKAVSDAARNVVKAASDIVDAGKAIVRFAEREVNGQGEIFSAAERRFRQGKVVDAIWHIQTGKLQNTNENAAELAKNELVNQVAASAATLYAGPAGAAGYAAWKTYNDTGGDVELALKSGAYAYAVQRYGSTAPIKNGTVGQVAKQAATTGAIAGLAVAAKGGSTKQSLDAFVEAGGAVVVQAGQAYVKKRYTDPAMAEADVYCTSLLDANKCAAASGWVDKAKELSHQNPTDKANIKVTADGNWAISWSKSALQSPEPNVPGVALTYVGKGSPFYDKVTELAKLGNENVSDVLPAHGWVFLGRYFGDGDWKDARADDLSGQSPDDIMNGPITLNRGVNLRSGPFEITAVKPNKKCSVNGTPIVGGLSSGTVVTIVQVVKLSGCRSYIWAEVTTE
ncbi:hypothetical protein NKH81_20475 [Mesorhizobium sp. M0959]|uniref:hypothetical protein n=1 Tax=Mesorhizobium sp. M0959 TaxID=2957034 RepID=UPI003339D521